VLFSRSTSQFQGDAALALAFALHLPLLGSADVVESSLLSGRESRSSCRCRPQLMYLSASPGGSRHS